MESKKNLVLVTGATGKQGGAVARELLAKGYPVRALTRRPDAAESKELAKRGAEIAVGNFDDKASLAKALAGAWGLFSLQNTWEVGVEREEEQGKCLAHAARKAGVQHMVYTSVASAHRRTGIPHFENKWRIEETIRGLGFPSHVILRPVFFMQNFTSPWFLPAIQQGQLAVGLKPGTVLQMIAVQDIGKYGLWAFERHAELNRREIDIAGDQHTMPETATILGKALKQNLAFVSVPIEEVRKFSDDYATMLEWFDRTGYDADIQRTSRESGITPTSLADWAASAHWAPAEATS